MLTEHGRRALIDRLTSDRESITSSDRDHRDPDERITITTAGRQALADWERKQGKQEDQR